MITRITFLVALILVLFIASANAEPAKWNSKVSVDDFDDTETFISAITAPRQGSLGVRYHESTPEKYEVYWVFPGPIFTTCGDSGSWMEHSGWRNVQIRVDGGKVLSLTGNPSTDKEAAFLEDGSVDTVEGFVKSLEGAKKVVIRVKDKCHEDGQSWIFSKFEDIAGSNYLSGIQY